MKSLRWIESQIERSSGSATKFPPLPGGEGRGEGERKHTNENWVENLCSLRSLLFKPSFFFSNHFVNKSRCHFINSGEYFSQFRARSESVPRLAISVGSIFNTCACASRRFCNSINRFRSASVGR